MAAPTPIGPGRRAGLGQDLSIFGAPPGRLDVDMSRMRPGVGQCQLEPQRIAQPDLKRAVGLNARTRLSPRHVAGSSVGNGGTDVFDPDLA